MTDCESVLLSHPHAGSLVTLRESLMRWWEESYPPIHLCLGTFHDPKRGNVVFMVAPYGAFEIWNIAEDTYHELFIPL